MISLRRPNASWVSADPVTVITYVEISRSWFVENADRLLKIGNTFPVRISGQPIKRGIITKIEGDLVGMQLEDI